MRILAIRIKNLASVEEAEIDFTAEPLASAGIFAITGETGAGKSTILDALCLALYAETPRYASAEGGVYIEDINGNKILQGDIRSILRDGTAEGQAEVEYLGVDGAIYRSTWIVKRAYNKVSGSLQDAKMLLHNVSEHKDISNAKREVLKYNEQFVGLNFQQFTRSVLLAQGDFTAFLKASKDDKASLLEKLTGTEIYTQISAAIHKKHKAESDALNLLEQKTKNIHTLSDEQLDELKNEKWSIILTLEENGKSKEFIRQAIQWYVDFALVEDQFIQAEKGFNSIKAEKEEAKPREEMLWLIDQADPIKPLFDQVRRLKVTIDLKEKALEKEQALLGSIDLEMLNANVQSAATALDQLLSQSELQKPAFDQAKKLDAEIDLRTGFVQSAKEAMENALERLKDLESKKSEKQALIEKNRIDKDNVKQWLETFQSKKSIAIHSSLILSKLQEAEASLHVFKRETPVLEKKKDELDQRTKKLESLQIEYESSLDQYKLEETSVGGLDKELQAMPIVDCRKQLSDLQGQKSDLLLLVEQWDRYILISNQVVGLEERIATIEEAIAADSDKLQELNDKIVLKKPVVENARQVFEKAKLAVSENIEKLRGQLVDGEECMVCGSREHPFAIHVPSDIGLKTVEQNYIDVSNELKEIETDKTKLELDLNGDQKHVGQLRIEAKNKNEEKENAYVKLTAMPIFSEYVALEKDLVSDFLATKQADTNLKIDKLIEDIDRYTKAYLDLEQKKYKLNEWRTKNETFAQTLNEIKLERISIEGEKNNLVLLVQTATNVLQQCKANLGIYFDTDNWYTHWEADPQKQLTAIKKFADDWTERSQAYEDCQNGMALLEVEVKGLVQFIETAKKDHKEKSVKYNEAFTELEQLKSARSLLFNGKAVLKVEEEMALAIRDQREQLRNCEEAYASARNLSIEYSTRISSLKDEANALNTEINELDIKIANWLDSFSKENNLCLDRERLEKLMLTDPQWIREEKSFLLELTQSYFRAESLLSQRGIDRDECLQRRVSQESLDSLRSKLEELDKNIKIIEKRLIEIDLLYKTDEANKLLKGSIAQDISNQAIIVNDLARLNELIGASDGKKFKLFAQEYTLDHLLGYANVHLRKLSQRYLLQRVIGTLGLQVVDRDMGDEVRPVFSLSGGESFLISLALALGLASLSSNRMNVESLFIDEGFGSLDPLTLSIAMDALERLQSEGRKVGVISHVQEMTERIPVQIKVSKRQYGRSKIKVTRLIYS